VDTGIVGSIIATMAYAWITGRTLFSGVLLALIANTGAAVVATMQGDDGIFWLFPTFVTSFFLTRPLTATLINTLAAAVLVLHGTAFDSGEQMWAFVASSIVVSACAYAFALR